MDTKAYISSGILEAYVLGALDEQEMAEVAKNLSQYSELAAELAHIEATMESFALAQAVTPPSFMKEQIWNAIQAAPETTATDKKIVPPPVAPSQAADTTPAGKTVPLQPASGKSPFRFARAAVWAALLVSAAINVTLWTRTKDMSAGNLAMQQQVDSLKTEQTRLAAVLETKNRETAAMTNPAMQRIVMESIEKEHPMAAMIYASKENGEIYLSLQNMPAAPQGMQYQLWIIKDGAPVDMGMIPNTMVGASAMQKMDKAMTGAQAYAISLEKEGGNPTPTKVMVMGKVS